MHYKVTLFAIAMVSIETYALPEVPSINRDVHLSASRSSEDRPQYTRQTVPTLQTTADGRVGMGHKLQENGRVVFRLQVPEKINQPFLTSAVGTGTDILSLPNQLVPNEISLASREIAGDTSSHMGLCDPAFDADSSEKNPKVCGPNNQDDCYDFTVIRSTTVDTSAENKVRRIWGTPVRVRVDNPKTVNARIVEVTAGTPVQGGDITVNGFLEPMTPNDGRLLFLRVGAGSEFTWRDSANVARTTSSDNVYLVNENPDNFAACDVRQWTASSLRPLTHAPYDTTINQRYGFAMQLFRDSANNVLADGVPIGTYPWIDKGGDNITFTSVGVSLYNPDTPANRRAGIVGQPIDASLNPRCVVDTGCEADLDSQNGSALNGRVMMGLWTRGKMVLMDGILNNTDFTLHADDISQRTVKLYNAGRGSNGRVRVGNGRDNREEFLPLGSSGNTTFFDSNEHRFNYLDNMKPITPADVTWLMSTGRGSDEVAFDDFLNPNSFINANMTQVIMVNQNNGARRTTSGQVQNAATGGRVMLNNPLRPQNGSNTANSEWRIPTHGDIVGNGRVEYVANGGIKGKGFWLDGNDSGLAFDIPAQTKSFADSSWFYGLYVDPRGNQTGRKALIAFPDGSEIYLNNGNQLVYTDVTGNQVRAYNINEPINTYDWKHFAFQVSLVGGSTRVVTYINGFQVNAFTQAGTFYQLEANGTLTVGASDNVAGFNGWIDDFKVFAEAFSPEVVCNQAGGTLGGISGSANSYMTNWAARVPASAHNAISSLLASNGKETFDRYVCYHDYSADYAANLANVPASLTSVRDAIIFPEGPILQDRPRPDSSNNAFCLSCHTADGLDGLDIEALELNPNLTAPNDPRRQPMQPDARVFGNIPANWLGNGIPARRIVANATTGYAIDNLVLGRASNEPVVVIPEEEVVVVPVPTVTPEPINSLTDLANATTFSGSSDNWVNSRVSYATDGNTSGWSEARTLDGERGSYSKPVWLEFNFGANYNNIALSLKESNSNPFQVSRWKAQRWHGASSSWIDISGWVAANSASTMNYPAITESLTMRRVRVLFQAPSGQRIGVQELNITGLLR